jgi:sugar phosphate isomerase/epimerase
MSQPLSSRRSFLTASAATCGALALGRSATAKEPLPLPLGIQMYSLRNFPVDQALDMVQQLGLTRVEFYPQMLPVTDDAEKIAAFKTKLADRGLTLSGYGVNGFGKNAEANRKIFEFAKAIGTTILLADPSPDAFENLDELVKEFDMRIAIHNHGPKHRYNKVLDVVSAIEKYDRRIGACADLGHYLRSGERPTDVIRALEGRLYGIHLKDHAEMKEGARGVILGKGLIDVPAVMEALVAVKFPADGSLSLEYEENAKNPLADLKECVAAARAALGQA